MTTRQAIKQQIKQHLAKANYPINSISDLVNAFPDGEKTVCAFGDVVITAGEAGSLLNADHFPFTSSEEVGETLVTLAGL